MTSSLDWSALGVRVAVDATLYAPGPSAAADLHIALGARDPHALSDPRTGAHAPAHPRSPLLHSA